MSIEVVGAIISLLSSVLGAGAVSESVLDLFKKIFDEKRSKLDSVNLSIDEEKRKLIQKHNIEIASYESDIATEAAISALDTTYHSISQIRNERMRQAKLAFNAALILVIIGVLIIFSGVGLLWFGGSIEAGSITVAVGAITEIISVLLFKFNNEANVRLDKVRNELSVIETAKIGLNLAKEITDIEKRDDAIASLTNQLQSKNG